MELRSLILISVVCGQILGLQLKPPIPGGNDTVTTIFKTPMDWFDILWSLHTWRKEDPRGPEDDEIPRKSCGAELVDFVKSVCLTDKASKSGKTGDKTATYVATQSFDACSSRRSFFRRHFYLLICLMLPFSVPKSGRDE
uniref:Secreted protein n=1 Tax=Steinernema glaseri TaxID=37863 RepID=A0A1I8AFX4_9BILA